MNAEDAEMPSADLEFLASADLELVELTREGRQDAFAELWRRHGSAGYAVARGQGGADPDDLLAQAFARILRATRAGGGPREAFRAYLFTTIRNVAAEWGRAANRVEASDELDELPDPDTEEDRTLAALNKGLTVTAFHSLPSRWQEALWYSEVERLSAREIAPLLGLKPNAVSALTSRAREGLRQAWIRAHLAGSTDPECRETIDRLGAYARGALGPREHARVEQHLHGCLRCSIVADEAKEVGSRLALTLLPLVAGIGGASSLAAWAAAGRPVETAATLPDSVGGEGSSGGSATSGVSSTASRISSRGWRIGIGVVAGMAALATVVALVNLPRGPSESVSTPAILEPPAPTEPSATQPAEPEQEPGKEDPLEENSTPLPPPPRASSPSTPPAPRPPVTPPVAATPVPTAVADYSAGPLVFPKFSGNDALPGALIEVMEVGGGVLASTTAGPAGSWAVTDFPSLTPGSRQVAVRQTVAGVASKAGTPMPLDAVTPPVILSPGEGSTVDQSSFVFELSGAPNSFVQALVGASGTRITQLDAAGHSANSYSCVPGPLIIVVRYHDAATGRFGVSSPKLTSVCG